MGTKKEIIESLKARAIELWGQERADAIRPGIETTAGHIWQLSQDLPRTDEEPGCYF